MKSEVEIKRLVILLATQLMMQDVWVDAMSPRKSRRVSLIKRFHRHIKRLQKVISLDNPPTHKEEDRIYDDTT